MPDYSNGKIYTIRCRTDDTKIYVGSTIQPLAIRFGGHKRNSKTENKKHYKIYTEINDNWDDWYIELYENYPCSCKEELRKREGEVIRLIGNLNMKIAGRNKKEYQIDNAEKIKEYNYQYNIENKDKNKQWFIENADKRKEYMKQYMRNYQKQYRLKKKANEVLAKQEKEKLKSTLQNEVPRQI